MKPHFQKTYYKKSCVALAPNMLVYIEWTSPKEDDVGNISKYDLWASSYMFDVIISNIIVWISKRPHYPFWYACSMYGMSNGYDTLYNTEMIVHAYVWYQMVPSASLARYVLH